MIEQIRPELTWRLRSEILYPGREFTEMEMAEDIDGVHFGAFIGNQLAAVVSLFQNAADFQFRKLAVDESFQRQGVGSALLQYITDYAAQNGGTRLWCNSRVSAIGFYLKAEFSQTGTAFSKNGFDYEVMEKAI